MNRTAELVNGAHIGAASRVATARLARTGAPAHTTQGLAAGQAELARLPILAAAGTNTLRGGRAVSHPPNARVNRTALALVPTELSWLEDSQIGGGNQIIALVLSQIKTVLIRRATGGEPAGVLEGPGAVASWAVGLPCARLPISLAAEASRLA